VLISLVYYDQRHDQTGVMNINGCLFLLLIQMTFQTVMAVSNVSFTFFYCAYAVNIHFT